MPAIPLTNIDAVLNPIESARGLPNEHYTSEGVFEEEKQAVLFNNWSAIGFAKDIPEAGDAKPTNFVGMPLLMVRDDDNNVNVFQNTCRHRGMILVQEPTKIIGAIRCPYQSMSVGEEDRPNILSRNCPRGTRAVVLLARK